MDKKNSFVTYLEKLRDDNNRGTLASLRRGLGKNPGSVSSMYPHVVPWIRNDADDWEESIYYMIASFFAFHPLRGGYGNVGDVFYEIKRKSGNSESIEQRFVALLNCNFEDLHMHLRHAISLAKSKDIAIDWSTLMKDLKYWNNPERFVQKNWAKSFWGSHHEIKDEGGDQKAGKEVI